MNEQKFHLGVKALIVNNAGEILILRANPKLLAGGKESYWDLPGGRIKQGSSVNDTLEREVEEELGNGTKIQTVRQFDACVSNHKIPADGETYGLVLFTFLCKLGKSGKILLSDEHTEYKWSVVSEAAKLLSNKFPHTFIEKLKTLGRAQ